MSTVRAAVLTAPETLETREFELPTTGPDDGLMRIEACGVCASDVPVFRGETSFELPVILGHEIVGRAEQVGERAAARWGVHDGDRIIVERWIPCGHCEKCYAGTYRLCVPDVNGHRLFYGGAPTTLEPGLFGGYADYLYLHPNAVVYRVAPHVPAAQVPLFTPLANAISWVQKIGGATIGSTVVIEGPGQEGLAAVVVARAAGASQIVVTGLSQDAHRLRIARELGATAVVDVERDDPVEAVGELTRGAMADVVLDLTSSTSLSPVQTAISVAGTGATIVVAAFHRDMTLTFDSETFANKTLTLRGAWGRDRQSVFGAIRILESGDYPVDRLATHHFGLGEAEEALRTVARERNPEALHVSLLPDR